LSLIDSLPLEAVKLSLPQLEAVKLSLPLSLALKAVYRPSLRRQRTRIMMHTPSARSTHMH
jgi:hypothetical protein